MARNISMELEGKEGMFRVEKTVGLYYNHVTSTEVKNVLTTIKKELGKMVKTGDVMFTVTSNDASTCGDRQSLHRFTFNNWVNKDVFTLESRKFNGYDFSNVVEYHFSTMTELLNFVIKVTKMTIYNEIEDIPTEKSRFSLQLDEKYV